MIKTKTAVERILRPYPLLFSWGSRLYYKLNRSFQTLSPGAPDAIFRALQVSKELNDGNVGDYYEFGLFRGYTYVATQDACRKLNITTTNFYGFDSFLGLPNVEGIDRANGQFFNGQFACRKEDVVTYLTSHGIDWSRSVLIEGFFKDSLSEDLKKKYPFKHVGVSFIDCDLYSSTCDVLTWLKDLVQENSILLFDDWYTFGRDPELGQPKAFTEFLAANPSLRAESFLEWDDHGRGFIIHSR